MNPSISDIIAFAALALSALVTLHNYWRYRTESIRSQVDHIAAWLDPIGHRVRLVNSSNTPVYDVMVTVVSANDSELKDGRNVSAHENRALISTRGSCKSDTGLSASNSWLMAEPGFNDPHPPMLLPSTLPLHRPTEKEFDGGSRPRCVYVKIALLRRGAIGWGRDESTLWNHAFKG